MSSRFSPPEMPPGTPCACTGESFALTRSSSSITCSRGDLGEERRKVSAAARSAAALPAASPGAHLRDARGAEGRVRARVVREPRRGREAERLGDGERRREDVLLRDEADAPREERRPARRGPPVHLERAADAAPPPAREHLSRRKDGRARARARASQPSARARADGGGGRGAGARRARSISVVLPLRSARAPRAPRRARPGRSGP